MPRPPKPVVWRPSGLQLYTNVSAEPVQLLEAERAPTSRRDAEFQRGSLPEGTIRYDPPNFVEYFDVASDPWQLNNLAAAGAARPDATLAALREELRVWRTCAGEACP